jgi:hypothetical protein
MAVWGMSLFRPTLTRPVFSTIVNRATSCLALIQHLQYTDRAAVLMAYLQLSYSCQHTEHSLRGLYEYLHMRDPVISLETMWSMRRRGSFHVDGSVGYPQGVVPISKLCRPLGSRAWPPHLCNVSKSSLRCMRCMCRLTKGDSMEKKDIKNIYINYGTIVKYGCTWCVSLATLEHFLCDVW